MISLILFYHFMPSLTLRASLDGAKLCISYHIILLYIIKVGLRLRNCDFNKFVDFKNKYIHIFWINMTNQVIKESNI